MALEPAYLLFVLLTNALERLTVFLLIHKAAAAGVALGPSLVGWVENLRAVAHSTATGVVTNGVIFSHFSLLCSYVLIEWVQPGSPLRERKSTKGGLPKYCSRPPDIKARAAWSMQIGSASCRERVCQAG